jgi:hypothetical protein
MPSSYQVVLWKQESFVVLRPLQIEFFRNLLGKDRRAKLRTKESAHKKNAPSSEGAISYPI